MFLFMLVTIGLLKDFTLLNSFVLYSYCQVMVKFVVALYWYQRNYKMKWVLYTFNKQVLTFFMYLALQTMTI